MAPPDPERPIGLGPIGEGPIGPQPDAGGDATFGWYRGFTEVRRRVVPLGIIAAGLVWVPFQPAPITVKWQQPLSRSVAIPRPARQGGEPFVPKEATRENTVNPVWLQAWRVPPRFRPPKLVAQPFVPREATRENTVTPDKWLLRWQGPPRYWPRKTNATYSILERQAAIFSQNVFAEINFTAEFHICGWGTEAQAAEGFVDDTQQADTWSGQGEEADVWSDQTAAVDASDEQAESDDDYDEKDECGR